MLLPREQNPWNCAYVLGAIALESLQQGPADLSELQSRMSAILGFRISPTQALSGVSWLYLLDKVKLDRQGRIILCS